MTKKELKLNIAKLLYNSRTRSFEECFDEAASGEEVYSWVNLSEYEQNRYLEQATVIVDFISYQGLLKC